MVAKYYNSQMLDNTTLHVGIPEDYKPAEHSIRVFRFLNNDLVIGAVVQSSVEQNSVTLTFPMMLDVYYCEEHDEEETYEFIPYLRNIIPFDIQRPYPVVFNLEHCLTATTPTGHVTENYYRTLLSYKSVSDELLGLESKNETMH
jgi:hypothetical protein